MQTLQKFRRYEFFLIFISITIYVIRRLFQEASSFDRMVTTAEVNGVPNKIIWQGLSGYNHFYNTIFPTIAGAIFLLGAWYVFHYLVYPRMKAKNFDSKLFIFIAVTILSTFICVFVFDYFKLHFRLRYDRQEHIIGMKIFSYFRKLALLTDTFAVLIIILFYEAFAQFYYFIHTKLKEEKEENYQYLDYFLIGTVSSFILFVALFANIPRKDYWFGAIRDLSLLGIGVVTIYFAQDYFYKKVLPYFSLIKSKEFYIRAIRFFIINFIGAIAAYFIQYISWLTYTHVVFGFHGEWIFQMFALFFFPSIVIAFLRKVLTKEKIQLQTQVVSKSAELSNLRSQINPHFLFNALNTLYSVSLKENAEKTADGIQKLGDMMRFMLNENHQDRIPLSKEIEYLNNYIDIQRMRIDESHDIEIKINIQNSEREIFIAPMLLNPFVENAFKHGISFRNPSWIYITLTHDAQKLYFKVHNSLHPRNEVDSGNELLENNGIGLENVKKRLELIYPNRYTLDIQASDNDYFVSLILGIY
jgi:two-component system, LytTR family, sensor kinase